MTREEQLDWLCRLRSEIYVYMPKEWLIPMNDALDMAIKALEQESIIKESEEYITKQALEDTLMTAYKHQLSDHDAKLFVEFMSFVDDLPSVTLQEPQTFKWCTDCKEYDQEKHCCHRWSKVIRNTVEEMKQEQEPILDKVRAEIEQYQSDYDVHGTEYDRIAWKAFNRCLQIIDKYKAGSEPQESEDDNAEQTYSGRGVKIYKEEIEDNY